MLASHHFKMWRVNPVPVLFTLVVLAIAPLCVSSFDTRGARILMTPMRKGDYYYQYEQIFVRKDPVDIVFLGSSTMWQSLDPRIVRQGLKTTAGKPVNAIVLASNWRGEDILYFQAKHLLENRKVKLLIVDTPNGSSSRPHAASKYFLNFSKDWHVLRDLEWHQLVAFYADSLLFVPKAVLSWFLPSSGIPNPYWMRSSVLANFGFLSVENGFYDNATGKRRLFVRHEEDPPMLQPDELIYTGQQHSWFNLDKKPNELNAFESVFVQKLVALAANHAVKLVFLRFPYPVKDARERVELRSGLQLLKVPTIGVPIDRLVDSSSGIDIFEYYDNPTHMNANGAQYFTKAILPALERFWSETK